jgi:glycosyltransferase involved in cell wall biosynthesis
MTARIADRFAVLGYELAEIYKQLNVPISKIRPIQYSVDENFFSPMKEDRTAKRGELAIAPDSVVVNSTCRLSQEKGIEYLMPALKQAVDRNDKIVCLVVGTGNMYAFASNFVKENNLDQRILLMGEATPRRVRDLLQISDIFVYSGVSSSNITLAVLEAMATQCAIVSTNVPKSHEILLADEKGIIVPVMDSTAIAKSIILLAGNANLRKRMGEKARKWVVRYHSSKVLKSGIESLVMT